MTFEAQGPIRRWRRRLDRLRGKLGKNGERKPKELNVHGTKTVNVKPTEHIQPNED